MAHFINIFLTMKKKIPTCVGMMSMSVYFLLAIYYQKKLPWNPKNLA